MKYKYLLLLIAIIFISGCGKTTSPKSNNSSTTKSITTEQGKDTTKTNSNDHFARNTALANPATVYCLEQQGKFSMKKDAQGGMVGYCTFPDGEVCEEWAFYKGECHKVKNKVKKEDKTKATSTPVATTTKKEANNQNTSSTKSQIEQDQQAKNNKDSKKTVDGDIKITAQAGEDNGEVIVSWDIKDLKAPNGFLVMLSRNKNKLTNPAPVSHKLTRPTAKQFVWVDLKEGTEYFFRTCIIAKDGSCETYSPIVSAYPKTSEE